MHQNEPFANMHHARVLALLRRLKLRVARNVSSKTHPSMDPNFHFGATAPARRRLATPTALSPRRFGGIRCFRPPSYRIPGVLQCFRPPSYRHPLVCGVFGLQAISTPIASKVLSGKPCLDRTHSRVLARFPKIVPYVLRFRGPGCVWLVRGSRPDRVIA